MCIELAYFPFAIVQEQRASMRIRSKTVDVVATFLLDFGKTTKFVSSPSIPFLLKKQTNKKHRLSRRGGLSPKSRRLELYTVLNYARIARPVNDFRNKFTPRITSTLRWVFFAF